MCFCRRSRPPETSLTKASPKAGQSRPGKATQWALKPPVAPPNFAPWSQALRTATHFSRRVAKTANSLPRRVGDADWPWVRASMDRSRHSQARALSAATSSSKRGTNASRAHSASMRGWAVWFTSWLVSPKWMNSLPTAGRPSASQRSLR